MTANPRWSSNSGYYCGVCGEPQSYDVGPKDGCGFCQAVREAKAKHDEQLQALVAKIESATDEELRNECGEFACFALAGEKYQSKSLVRVSEWGQAIYDEMVVRGLL